MTFERKIRVLVVDDSAVYRQAITAHLAKNERIEVVGSAVDAFDAQTAIQRLNPDVVTLDVQMPKMNGIEFLKKLLPQRSLPVVLVSSLNMSVFDALSAGAVDFVRKPDATVPGSTDQFFQELIQKIIAASGAKVRMSMREIAQPLANTLKASPKLDNLVIALGASTGGTEATLTVIKNLPAHTPGIVVVQHMPPGFTTMYANRLNNECVMEVKEAQSGDRIQRGRVLIAPGDAHVKVVRIGASYSVQCFQGEKVNGHCPSVDVMFDSVAENVGANAVGIILTGMGRDGARGLLAMREKGAFTIGQNKESCVVYGMPMEAYKLGAVVVEAACEDIESVLKQHLNKR